MDTRIDGVIAQTLHLTFARGESCWAAKGSIVAIDGGIEWNLRMPGGAAGALRRGLAGEGLTLGHLQARREAARAVLGGNSAGKIAVWELGAGGGVLATRGAFLAAVGEADISVAVARRAGAAFFGGAGLFLQRLRGTGTVFLHGAGDFLEYELGRGETMAVSTGNLAAFAEGIDYRVRSVGSLRKVFFGGEGLFMTELVGPGRVLLQSLKRRGQGQSGKR
jgi:uncharacterized protein (TIGR00266 family)